MKESPHELIDGAFNIINDNIQSFLLAFVIVIGSLCALVYGIAWLSAVEKENTAFYGARHLEERVNRLEKWQTGISVEYGKHTHRYSDGKIK